MSKRNASHVGGHKKVNSLVVKVVLVLLAVLVLVTGVAYAVFHHFYSKMNTAGTMNEAEIQENIEAFKAAEAEKESEDINALEDTQKASQEEIDNLHTAIQESMTDPEEKAADEKVWNILLIGTDARSLDEKARSDAMILLSLNSKTKQITLTSFMRDIYTYIPGAGFYNRLNVPNLLGGPEMLVDTIEQMFDISIDNYALVNFYSFIDIVDILGGVDIEITAAEVDEINASVDEINYNLGRPRKTDFLSHSDVGLCHLNGNQALGYARIRHIGGDMQRTERQRLVLTTLAQKAKTASATELLELANTILPMITTDLSETDCLALASKAPEYLKYEVQTLRIPEEGAYFLNMINGMSVVQMEFDTAKKTIRETIYGTEEE